MAAQKSRILAIGGGKGGVGKSLVSASLAVALAQLGRKTVIVDLDLGGANLHTLFGLKNTERGIGDFIYNPSSPNLIDYAVSTGVDNLRLISGNGFIPGIANLEYQRKVRVIKALSQMDADYIVLDLGAGTNYNVIDFFMITQSGIIVTMHEPTAILNGYEFLKNVVFRIYSRELRNHPIALELVEKFKVSSEAFAGGTVESLIRAVKEVDPEAETIMRRIHSEFRPAFVVNMCRADTRDFSRNLEDISRTYLSIRIQSLGSIPHDVLVHHACMSMKPFMLECPHSQPAYVMRNIAMECTKSAWLDSAHAENIDEYAVPDQPAAVAAAAAGAASAPAGTEHFVGKSDTELSSLMANFLQESSSVAGSTSAGTPAVKTEEQKEDETVLADMADTNQTLGVGLELPLPGGSSGIRIPLEPRMRPNTDTPYFASLPKSASDGGLFSKLFGTHGKSDGPSARHEEFELIRGAPHSRDVTVRLKTLGDRANHGPADGREWIQTGLVLANAHRMTLAQKAFDYARQSLPDDEVALNNWAASLMAMGTTGQVLDILNSGVAHHRQSICLRFNLGIAHMILKQYKEAAACFVMVRGLTPGGDQSFPADFLEGYCHYQNRDYTQSEMVFRSIIKRDSLDAHAQYNWALSKIQLGAYEHATQTLSELIANSPSDFEAFAARGLAYWKWEKPEQALADYSKVLHLEPANLTFYTAHAAMAYQAGRLDIAIADLQKVMRLVPKNETFQRLFNKIRSELNRPKA